MDYVTHKREDGRYQLLKDHIENVARLTEEFSKEFDTSGHGRLTGQLHDIGKYSENGQARQIDPEHVPPQDHSTAGVKQAIIKKDVPAAFAVAGHHGGLPDIGTKALESGTLLARNAKQLTGKDDPSRWRDEIHLADSVSIPQYAEGTDRFASSFYTRMLFSCLVDADYLDTENFMCFGKISRSSGADIQLLNERMQSEAHKLLDAPQKYEINRKRCEVLRECIQGDDLPRGLYTLTVPTGGGKTKSSLAFALAHAAKHHLKRIIYVIPYTSIIEQNAKVFSDILGEENVLEHHSNIDFDEYDNVDERQAKILACENWDAPVIVTTAVQFFESLFAAKTSRCRKLHNIADSVVIFDEAQMLPIPYIRPCIAAITELVRHYGVTAVLCTATQPALNGIVHEFAPELKIREITSQTDELYTFFRRVRFQEEPEMETEDIANQLQGLHQALCIVNTRAKAREIYELLDGDGVFCLTTLLTPNDRSKKLKEIRERLKPERNERCIVVSTCLIEAGVDVDFPTVWREICGLDSILQAAGRCNRENRRHPGDSVVHIFAFPGAQPQQFRQNIASTQSVLSRFAEIDTREAIKAYYDDLFLLKGKAALDVYQIINACKDMKFRTVAENFRIINEDTITVYIPTEQNEPLLNRLRNGERNRELIRRLAHDSVSIYTRLVKELEGALERLDGGNIAILVDASLYHSKCGLTLMMETGKGLFI